MKFFKDYERVIAIKERSAGNETVGDSWIDTKSFPKETPIEDIIQWAGSVNEYGTTRSGSCSGKLIITIDEPTPDKEGE